VWWWFFWGGVGGGDFGHFSMYVKEWGGGGGVPILKCAMSSCEGKEWIHLAEDGIQGRVFVNMIVTDTASVQGVEYLTTLTAGGSYV